MKKNSASAAKYRRVYVPLFNQFRNNLKKDFDNGRQLQWIPVETSLLLRSEFATISLQSRGVFVSILLLCGLLGTDEIDINTRYLANALAADERTLKNCIEELIRGDLLREKEIEKEIERKIPPKTPRKNSSPSAKKSGEKKESDQTEKKPDLSKFCTNCKGTKKLQRGEKQIDCPYCYLPNK